MYPHTHVNSIVQSHSVNKVLLMINGSVEAVDERSLHYDACFHNQNPSINLSSTAFTKLTLPHYAVLSSNTARCCWKVVDNLKY